MNTLLDSQSTRPYLVRAIYEWCTDNAFTPYLAVQVDESVQVPREYVRNGEIVLNISFDATSGLQLGNDYIEFKARFGGVSRDIMVPLGRVLAIYALENGQGMAFPVSTAPMSVGPAGDADSASAPRKGLSVVPTAGTGVGAAKVVSLMPQGATTERPAPPGAADAASADKASAPSDGDDPPPPDTPRPGLKLVR